MSAGISTVTSKDGTTIAFDRIGAGPSLILVVGAFNDRSTGAPLAEVLASSFTTVTYDRRGRGASGDTAPYAVEREVEDLDALIDVVGGEASVFGYSSGAALALKAAAAGSAVRKLALYDLPPIVDDGLPLDPVDHATMLADLVAEGRRGDAVEYFQSKLVGLPDEIVAQLRHAPFRPALEAMAHTLVYEAMLVAARWRPEDLASSITVPTLAVAAGAGSRLLPAAAQALAAAVPNARAVTLDGQTHDIDPMVLGPVLEEFFLAR
jgi:pimeloyl-ACP methyl ester carboxylesterase